MEKKEEERIKNLDEKIYTVCFSEPRFSDKIKTTLYYKDTSKYPSVSRMFSKMVKKNELLELAINAGKKNHDGSIPITLSNKKIPFTYTALLPAQQQMKRNYYLSSVEPALNEMLRVLAKNKVKITAEEKIIIKELMDSQEYRKAIGYVFESRIKDYRTDLNPLDLIVTNFCNTAAAIYSLISIISAYGKTKKDLLDNWDILTEAFIRKQMQQNKLLKIPLDNMGESVSSVVKNKEVGRLFLEKTNDALLQKLMMFDPSCQANANFIILGAAIHTKR